jgi:hypothetical protein
MPDNNRKFEFKLKTETTIAEEIERAQLLQLIATAPATDITIDDNGLIVFPEASTVDPLRFKHCLGIVPTSRMTMLEREKSFRESGDYSNGFFRG